jgi:diguanylate cyclase (GGDEF)-like protein/PAS domain S-box-containing protein
MAHRMRTIARPNAIACCRDEKTGLDSCNPILEAISQSTALVEFTLDGTIVAANEKFRRLMGYGERELIGLHHRVLVDPADATTPAYTLLWERLRQGELMHAEFKRIARDGREIWLSASFNPVMGSSGKPRGVLKIATDITLQRQRASGYRNIVDAMSRSTALLEMNLDGTIIGANDLFLRLVGYDSFDIVGRHHRMFVDPAEAAAPAYVQFWENLRSGAFIRSEFRRITSDGSEIWLLASYNPVLDMAGRPYKILKIANDVTAAVHQRAWTAQLAVTDGLTGLTNRRAFNEALEREFRRAERSCTPVSLVMIDVDHFKKYNDRYGHQSGDDCLVAVARAIQGMARRPGDTAARYGGEEFAVILAETDGAGAVEFAEALRDAIQRGGIAHEDNAPSRVVTVSVGVASYPMAPEIAEPSPEKLLAIADKALYAAKRSGRNRVAKLETSSDTPADRAHADGPM